MSVYVPGETLFVFDTMPPRQFVGARAYRKAFEGLLEAYSGPTRYDVEELSVTADRTVGFCHWICHMEGTARDGSTAEMNFASPAAPRRSATHG
jgi:ketosteroid isomerase-like protein